MIGETRQLRKTLTILNCICIWKYDYYDTRSVRRLRIKHYHDRENANNLFIYLRQQNIIYLNNKIIYGRGFQNQIGDKLVAFGVFKGFANLNRRYLPFFVWILIFAASVFLGMLL